MTLTRRDLAATVVTTLAVATFFATHEGWGVPLVGDSRRWAAGAIMLLGAAGCALGSPSRSGSSLLCAALGIVALILGILALVTASLTPLSVLVADIVLLWAISTFGHARHVPRRPLAV